MANPASLRLVQSSSAPTGTGSYSYKGTFQIVVENLAYEKDVAIWAKVGSTWQAIPATYVESLPGNLELWTAPASNGEDRFAVRYTVSGATYWDNNAGWDYVFPKAYDEFNAITGRESPVVLGQASVSGGQLVALAAIQNLAYAKVVGIVYTVDDWQTVQVAYASYHWTMSSGLEVWRVQAMVGSSTDVQFALFYFVLGNEYWDNNFWRNYAVSPTSAYVAKSLVKHRTHEPWTADTTASKPDLAASSLPLPAATLDPKEKQDKRPGAGTN